MASSPCGGTIGLFGTDDVWIIDVATGSIYTHSVPTRRMWVSVKWAPYGSTIVASEGVDQALHVFHASKHTHRIHAIGLDRTMAVPPQHLGPDQICQMQYMHEYRSPSDGQSAAGSEA